MEYVKTQLDGMREFLVEELVTLREDLQRDMALQRKAIEDLKAGQDTPRPMHREPRARAASPVPKRAKTMPTELAELPQLWQDRLKDIAKEKRNPRELLPPLQSNFVEWYAREHPLATGE